jgi:hypothetical protein
LTQDQVTLARSDGRLTFKDLKEELGTKQDTEINFRRQKLCEPVPDPGEDNLRIFDRDGLRKCLIPYGEIPAYAETFGVWDTSMGGDKGDFSCGLVIARSRDTEGITHLYVKDCFMEKVKPHDLAVSIVMQYLRSDMRLRIVGIEKPHNAELLEERIREVGRVRLPYGKVPVVFLPVDNQKDAKVNRVKNAQILAYSDPIQLHFAMAPWNDLLFDQLCNFTTGISGASDEKRDDGPDCLGIACNWLLEGISRPENPEAQKTFEEQKKEQQRQWELESEQRASAAMYQMRFGPTVSTVTPEPAPARPRTPAEEAMEKILGKNSPFLKRNRN